MYHPYNTSITQIVMTGGPFIHSLTPCNIKQSTVMSSLHNF